MKYKAQALDSWIDTFLGKSCKQIENGYKFHKDQIMGQFLDLMRNEDDLYEKNIPLIREINKLSLQELIFNG